MGINFKKIFKREPPINGGNSFEMEKILHTKEDVINDYLRQDLVNLKANQYNYWELLNFQADYFSSLVRVTFEDNELDPKIYMLFRCHFLYGNVGLLKKGEDLIPIVESSHHIDSAGNIKKIVGYSAYEVTATTGTLTENEKKFKTKYIITKKDMENYCRLHVGSWGFGAIVRWHKFILQHESLLKKIHTYSYLLTKKIIYNVNDVSAANIEVRRFFSDDYPFLVNMDTLNPNANQFNVENFGQGNGGSEELFFYYREWLKIYYEMLGRRLNVDKKGERNIVSEVEASQDQFLILENEQKINKINFIKLVEKLVGKIAKFLDEQSGEIREQDRDGNQEVGREGKEKGIRDDLPRMNT